MEKNTLEQITPSGNTIRYVEEKTGMSSKFLTGAAVIGAVGLAIMLKGKNKNGKPSFFTQYITPLIMAAAYKKLIEVIESNTKPSDKEMPAIA